MFKKLKEGATFGIISPAWIPLKERIYNGEKYLQERGFKTKSGKNLNKTYGYFAGTDQERVRDIHDMYTDKDVDIIICTRGGWGTLRFLDKIDYELIRSNPKPLIGYSDLTSLQNAIYRKTGLGSLSGPMLAVEMGKGISDFTEKNFWGYLLNKNDQYKINLSATDSQIINSGTGTGKLLGGCLSLVSHLLGTSFCPDFSGSVLFLEDVGEKPYKIDRYLAHLKQAGIFDKINGLILGEFLDCDEENENDNFRVDEIIDDYISGAQYPIVKNFPYGHGDNKITMPIGTDTKLNLDQNEVIFSDFFAAK